MDTQSFKTFNAKPDEVERDWYVVDATNQVVGRLASQIARVLRGKHKPTFTPHVDTGDYVIVVNADKARFTGKKEKQKKYHEYSGYPGGDHSHSPEEMRADKPTYIIKEAVEGMLPTGPLGRDTFKKLKVYAGPDHPHEAQQPEPLDNA
ncbi:large subunit ribosomal protein L13 [Salinibacter ruber]|uniref:Large ribosomal subunit protein uL13 n=1 Tax=Salinibacter ruber TaxID=146919 RepID=A0A9X2TEU3_9BACT|nr:50S ribosomal protein L13 [Salinibacter ruber]MCS3678374.1 large subunit ribosomal protein L13 [Salinibacter ruber]MCS3681661.1 large subunit ribosomal protein L13 [Salinibacter ruber]